MTQITIQSHIQPHGAYITDLHHRVTPIEWGRPFQVEGWFRLTVPHQPSQWEITRLAVNDVDMAEHLYTSWYEDTEGQRHQPATTAWGKGQWHMWLHSEPATVWHRNHQSIRNGDYGQSMWENYVLTEDWSITIDEGWPPLIQSYFRSAEGPRWWRRDTLATPWQQIDRQTLADIDRRQLEQDMWSTMPRQFEYDHQEIIEHRDHSVPRMRAASLHRHATLPLTPVTELESPVLREVCRRIGLDHVANVMIQSMPPGGAFVPHIDDHWGRPSEPITEGSAVFIWNIADDSEGHLFKLGGVGMVPDLDTGVWFNQHRCSHGTINQGTQDRPLIIIQGDRGIPYRANT
jgi:hypothetical protein